MVVQQWRQQLPWSFATPPHHQGKTLFCIWTSLILQRVMHLSLRSHFFFLWISVFTPSTMRCFPLARPTSAPPGEEVLWQAVKTKSCLRMWFLKNPPDVFFFFVYIQCMMEPNIITLCYLHSDMPGCFASSWGCSNPPRKLVSGCVRGIRAAVNGRACKQIICSLSVRAWRLHSTL